MAAVMKEESSDEDLYGDIDDMYLSQSETESTHKSEDVLTPTVQHTSQSDQLSQEDPGSDVCGTEDNNMNDLDLYDDLIAVEDLQKVNSFQEMMKKFEEAMKMIQQLESENKTLRESLNKQETSSKDIQRNISSLLITAKGEINRKEKELNKLRKELTGKQRTPGRFRNQRETNTEGSSITSIDSDFDPPCVSSPGRLILQRIDEKSPNKYRKEKERHSRSTRDSFDRSRQNNERSDEDFDSRKRSKSKNMEKINKGERKGNNSEKEEINKKSYEGRKHRKYDQIESSKRYSEHESDVSSPDKSHRKVDQKLNVKNRERNSKDEIKAKDNRQKKGYDDLSRHGREKDKSKDHIPIVKNNKGKNVEDNVNDKSSEGIGCSENGENSGIKDSGNKPKVLDLREKLRLKRLSGKQTTDLEETVSEIHSSSVSLSVRSSGKNIDSFPVSDSNDPRTLNNCRTLSNSVSKASEMEPRKRQMKKGNENLNAEKEFLEQLKMSIKKNEIASSKVKSSTHLQLNENIDKDLRKENTSRREIISYSDASNEVSDMENVPESNSTIQSEKYFTASELSNHNLTCETPVMSEQNEILTEVNSIDTIDKVSAVEMDNKENTYNEVKDKEISEGFNDKYISDSCIPGSGLNENNAIIMTETTGKCEGKETTELMEISSKCDDSQDDFEPMEIQSEKTSLSIESAIHHNVLNDNSKIDLSQTDSNFDIKESELTENSVNVSPNLSNSSKNEETPGSARRRSARLLSKSETSVNCSKTNANNICVAEEVKNSEKSVETEAETNSDEKSKGRNLQRSCSKTGKRKRVRRCVTSETISCITSVSDSDIFNSISDETGDLSMSTDDTETSEDTHRTESSSELQNLVCTDKNYSSESSSKLQNLVCTDKNCTIKMRHLHPKCNNGNTKSPEFQKETLIKSDTKPNESLINKKQNKTDEMETDNKEMNALTGWNDNEILNYLDVDSELVNIHGNKRSEVSGTIEVTAEESVDDSESSSSSTSGSSSSSSDTGSSSGSSDSESELSDRNTESHKDNITNEKPSAELINNAEFVKATKNSESKLTVDQVESVQVDLHEINTLDINCTINEREDSKKDKTCDELQTIANKYGQSIIGMNNATGDKLDKAKNVDDHGIETFYGNQQKEFADNVSSNKDAGNLLNGEKFPKTDNASKSKENIKISIQDNISVFENVTNVNNENGKQNRNHIQCTLKEKTGINHPPNLASDSMESDNCEQIRTEISGTEEKTKLQVLETVKGKEQNSNKVEASENESEGSFGSNIMSERTDSLQSGDESEFSASYDSGSSYSGDSTYSSSDESGTGSSWETYSSDSDSEEVIIKAKKSPCNKEKLVTQEHKNTQNIEVNSSKNRENMVEKEEVSKAKTANTLMETEDSGGTELMTKTNIEEANGLNKETPTCNDIEMKADDEMEFQQSASISEKPNIQTVKSPEKIQVTKCATGISPDRSHMLQCLLNCVQNELKSNASYSEKVFNEEETAVSTVCNISKINEEVTCSEPLPNNVEMENASINSEIESYPIISSSTQVNEEETAVSTICNISKINEEVTCSEPLPNNVEMENASINSEMESYPIISSSTQVNEEETAVSTICNISKINEEVTCSEPLPNNVEMENASINSEMESYPIISSSTDNTSVSCSEELRTAKLTEVIYKAQVCKTSEKEQITRNEEKMIMDNVTEENVCGADLSGSSDESDSGDSSSGFTHPTDCSTCTSYSGSSSDSETEGDEEMREAGKCGNEVTNIGVNCESNDDKGMTKSLESVKSMEKTVCINEDIASSESRNETLKDMEVRNVIVNESITGVNDKAVSVIPCKNNPYWIADELPEFLQSNVSIEISDENTSNRYKKKISNSSPGTECSRPVTPAVKFANLSPRSKVQKTEQVTEVKEVKKNLAIGVISSVVQFNNEGLNNKLESSKNLKTKHSMKPDPKLAEENTLLQSTAETGKCVTTSEQINNRCKSKVNNLSNKPKSGISCKAKKSPCGTKSQVSQKASKHAVSKTAVKSLEKSCTAKKKGSEKVTERRGNKEKNVTSKAHQNKNDKTTLSTNKKIEQKEKEIVNQPLRRSPRKKASQSSVTDTKECETVQTCKKSNFTEKTSGSVSPRKGMSKSKTNLMKTDNKSLGDKRKVDTSKLENTLDKVKSKNIDGEGHSSKQHLFSVENAMTDKDSNSGSSKKANEEDMKRDRKKSGVLKETSEHSLVEESMMSAENTISVDSKRDRKKEKGSSQQLAKERNEAKSHFRDTTRELSEKIMKLKVEQNMLKKELAEKQRLENDSLKLKLTIPRAHDSKSRKDTKENIKGKAPLQSLSKSGKTQPLKVAMATNGHKETRCETGTSKTGAMNKNENLTFEKKLGDLDGYLSKSNTVSKSTKKNASDASMSLIVQNASFKTFTIPKLLDTRKGESKEEKKPVTKSKSESSVSQNRSIYCSNRKNNAESKINHSMLNKRDGLKLDSSKKSKIQSKPTKRFLSSESESDMSDSDSERDTDSSNTGDSNAILRAMFGSSDSSGNSKKSITLADLRKTRSSEDTDDIVKDFASDEAINPKECDVIKSKSFEPMSCKEKDVSMDKATNFRSHPAEEQTKKVTEKSFLSNKPSADKYSKESKSIQSAHKLPESKDKLIKDSGKVEMVKRNIKGHEKDKIKASDKINAYSKGKEFAKSSDHENNSNKSRNSVNNKLDIKSSQGQKGNSVKKKFGNHETDKEKERKTENVSASSSEITLRKSPRIKARTPVKDSTSSNDNSRVEFGAKNLRSDRTPSKSEKNKCGSNSEVRYFELSDKNPIFNKIISPKKPKLKLHDDEGETHCNKTDGNSKEVKKLEKVIENESKGVPILLLEDNTMDGIDYHDDVTLDTGSGCQLSNDDANYENDGDDESSENSDTNLSVEEGELSDSDEDNSESLECTNKPLKMSAEVTPKKQKMMLNTGALSKGRISPVRFLSGATSCIDSESSCKCSQKDCIHTRLALNINNQRKRHRSDTDSASDCSMSRQKRKIRPDDYSSGRNRTRNRSDNQHAQKTEKFTRKSPVRSHRRTSPRRRPPSRSTSPLRENRKRSRSRSPRKSRTFRREKESAVSRYRNESGTDSPRSHRRYRSGSRERSGSPHRYRSRRKSQSCRDNDSENTIDDLGKKTEMKRHYLEKGTEDRSTDKCRDNERKEKHCSDNSINETSDEESERFSKLRFEKTTERVKGKEFPESRPESRRIRYREGRSSRDESDYRKGRRRSRSISRSPRRDRRGKRLRSESESEVSDRVDVKDRKNVRDKHKDSDSPSYKRSKPSRSGLDR